MPMLNTGQLQLLFATLRTRWMEAYQTAPTWSDSIVTTESSDTENYEVSWVEVLPEMEKWVATKTIHGTNVRGFTAKNEPWQTAIGIDRRKTLVDLHRVLPQQVEMMGRNVKKYKDNKTKVVLQNGKVSGATFDNYLWYDKKPAFAINRPVNIGKPALGVWQNLYTGRPLDVGNLEFGIQQMAGLLTPNGVDAWGIIPNVLLVPGTLGQVGKRLTGNDLLGRIFEKIAPAGFAAASESNPFQGELKLVIADDLSNEPNVWYLLDTRFMKKPISHFQVQAPTEAPNNGIMMPGTHEVVYSYEANGSFFIGQCQAIARFEAV